jgi:hypothetical protein
MRRASIGAALAALVVAAGCRGTDPGEGARAAGEAVHARTYDDGAAGLRALWSDILTAAQRDERETVHERMNALRMSDDDLVALFGEQRGRWLAPRYAPMFSRLANIGAMELVAQIADQKYDDVEVFQVAEGSASPSDKAVLAALRAKVAVYGVRVKKKQEKLGLRYDFFVYRNGRWVTGNQLGKVLAAASAALPAGESPSASRPRGGPVELDPARAAP